MVYQANKRQFGALEGLAHWCAEYYYTLLGAKRRPCMGRELEGHEIGVF